MAWLVGVSVPTTLLDAGAYPAAAVAELDRWRWRIETDLKHLKIPMNMDVLRCETVEGVLKASLGIVVTYDPQRGGPTVLGRHAIADAGLYSVCLAIENLWLAATAEGLGVGWVSFYREEFLRQLLGIPSRIRPVAWLCLGPIATLQTTPDLERHGWCRRIPLSQVLHEEQFGRPALH